MVRHALRSAVAAVAGVAVLTASGCGLRVAPVTPTPTPSAPTWDVAALPVPSLTTILPTGLPQVTGTGLAMTAHPHAERTPAWTTPDATLNPTLALDSPGAAPAGWYVTGQTQTRDKHGTSIWVQVLIPFGRGALPSTDPHAVNHHAAWLRADDVDVTPTSAFVLIDVAAATATITSPTGATTVAVGVGIDGATGTPRGLCQISGHAATQAGDTVITNCQSETLDGFEGVPYAATALHVGVGQGGQVSHGCIRFTPEAFKAVWALPAGTPVVIAD